MPVHNNGNRRNLHLIPVANGNASSSCFVVKKMTGYWFKLNILPHVKERSLHSWFAKIYIYFKIRNQD